MRALRGIPNNRNSFFDALRELSLFATIPLSARKSFGGVATRHAPNRNESDTVMTLREQIEYDACHPSASEIVERRALIRCSTLTHRQQIRAIADTYGRQRIFVPVILTPRSLPGGRQRRRQRSTARTLSSNSDDAGGGEPPHHLHRRSA